MEKGLDPYSCLEVGTSSAWCLDVKHRRWYWFLLLFCILLLLVFRYCRFCTYFRILPKLPVKFLKSNTLSALSKDTAVNVRTVKTKRHKHTHILNLEKNGGMLSASRPGRSIYGEIKPLDLSIGGHVSTRSSLDAVQKRQTGYLQRNVVDKHVKQHKTYRK